MSIAGDIEVKVVFLDLLIGHYAGILFQLKFPAEDVHDLVDILFPQAVFVAVFDIALAGIDDKDGFAAGSILFINHYDAGGDAGAVEEIGRQANDAFDVAAFDDILANLGLGIASEKNSMGQDDGSLAGTF